MAPLSDDAYASPLVPFGRLLYRSTRWSWLSELGVGLYEKAATKVGSDLQGLLPEVDLRWYGGSVYRCLPGISDLDFLLIVEREKDLLPSFRAVHAYRKSRPARYFPLGEIQITTRRLWNSFKRYNPGPLLWFRFQKRWTDSQWLDVQEVTSHQVSLESLLSLSLYHLSRAQVFLLQSRQYERALLNANFKREITKAIDYCERGISPCYLKGDPADLLARAYRGTDLLARTILATKKDPEPLVKMKWQSGRGARFENEQVIRKWERFFRAQKNPAWNCLATSFPSVFVGQIEDEDLNLFFKWYLNSLFFSETPTVQAPLILSPSVHEMVIHGCFVGDFLEGIYSLPIDRLEEDSHRVGLEKSYSQHLFELAVTEANVLIGKIIQGNEHSIRQSVRGLLVSGASLACKKLTLSASEIPLEVELGIPETTQLLKKAEARYWKLSRSILLDKAPAVLAEIAHVIEGHRLR